MAIVLIDLVEGALNFNNQQVYKSSMHCNVSLCLLECFSTGDQSILLWPMSSQLYSFKCFPAAGIELDLILMFERCVKHVLCTFAIIVN